MYSFSCITFTKSFDPVALNFWFQGILATFLGLISFISLIEMIKFVLEGYCLFQFLQPFSIHLVLLVVAPNVIPKPLFFSVNWYHISICTHSTYFFLDFLLIYAVSFIRFRNHRCFYCDSNIRCIIDQDTQMWKVRGRLCRLRNRNSDGQFRNRGGRDYLKGVRNDGWTVSRACRSALVEADLWQM